MFSGLVQTLGQVQSFEAMPDGAKLTIRSPVSDWTLGESVAVDGACLTVELFKKNTFEVHLAQATLKQTTLGLLKRNARVHLERALRLSDRLGGHLLSGHIDGVGVIKISQRNKQGIHYRISLPAALRVYTFDKGSIAIDGVSLTIQSLSRDGVEVMIVPHTAKLTKFGAMKVYQKVNVEVDMLAKYVVQTVRHMTRKR